MKKLAILFILFTFCISGCNKDEIIPLPENITIQILDYDIDDSSVLILGSEPQDGLEGKWSIENNVSDGAFVDSNNSLTTFRGTLIKDYLLSLNNS